MPTPEQPPSDLPPGLWDDLRAAFEPRYQLRGVIGRGGMGVVIEAFDPLLERLVAIKVLNPESLTGDPTARERLLREARAAATLSHPNVVGVFGVGETPSQHAPYILMQRIEGETLERRDAGAPLLDIPTAMRILGDVADALAMAHGLGLVHRDLKPSNVMVDTQSGRAVVLDFGISHFTPAPGRIEAKLTGTGMYLGTPMYMSPEQAAGEPATEKSDIYSLGCLLYEVLAGRPVFQGPTAMVVMAAHIKDAPTPLRQLRPDVPEPLANVIEAMLAKDPKGRPSADDLRRRFAPVPEHHPWVGGAVESIRRRLRAVASTGSAVAVLALLQYAFLTGTLPPALPLIRSGLIGAIAVAFLLFAGASVAAYLTFRRDPISPRLVQLIAGDWTREAGILADRLREFAEVGSQDQRRLLDLLRWRGTATLAAGPLILGILILFILFPGPASLPLGVQWSLLLLPLGGTMVTSIWIALLRGQGGWRASLPVGLTPNAETLRSVEGWVAHHGRILPAAGGKGSPLRGAIALLSLVAAAIGVSALIGLQAFALRVRDSIHAPNLDQATESFRSFEPILALAPEPTRTISDASTRIAWGKLQAPWSLFREVEFNRYVRGLDHNALFRALDQLGVRYRDRYRAGELLLGRGYRGLTPAERRMTLAVVERPGLAELRTAARSARSEAWDVILAAPGATETPVVSLHIPFFEFTRAAVYQQLLAATLALDRGRVDSAETMMWDLVRLGRLQAQVARTITELYTASFTAQMGASGLRAIFARRKEVDSLLAVVRPREELSGVPRRGDIDLGEWLEHLVADTSAVRGVRWEALQLIRLRSCAEPRMLLGGADPAYAAAAAAARATLVFDRNDSTLIGIIDRTPAAAAHVLVNRARGRGWGLVAAAILADLLGREELAGCLNLDLMGTW